MATPFKHPYVEDYIEIIAGYRLPNGKDNYSLFEPAIPIVSLARYDMKIVPSLAEQTIAQGKGYTDKQAKLAADLVLKYERQLAKHGIDVAPVRAPKYRLTIRQIDRSTRVWIENDGIKLKFPYDTTLIDAVRSASRESKGRFVFNRELRIHEAELTEWNLNWIYSFAQQNNFEIDASVKDLMDLLLAAEQQSYKIELGIKHDKLCITNAEPTLIEYVETKSGGFGLDNLLRLCDQAPVLGYTISKEIEEHIIKEQGTRFFSLCANRNIKVDVHSSKNLIQEVFRYAEAVDRFPIFIYEPDLSGRLLEEFSKYVTVDQIALLENKKTDQIFPESKIVYASKIPRMNIDRIPLMISSAGMLYGGERQMWLQSAEKIVYFSNDVYNKNIKGTEVCRLD
jgi:hypothetical protein